MLQKLLTDLKESGSNESDEESGEESVEDELSEQVRRPVIVDVKEILANYKKMTTRVEYKSIFQQHRGHPKYVFYAFCIIK